MINHRGGILIFGQIFYFDENRKFQIWQNSKSLTLAKIEILDP